MAKEVVIESKSIIQMLQNSFLKERMITLEKYLLFFLQFQQLSDD